LIPAGQIERVDVDDRKVLVDLTKEQTMGSSEYDAETFATPAYQRRGG
jgi:hypothetical protein